MFTIHDDAVLKHFILFMMTCTCSVYDIYSFKEIVHKYVFNVDYLPFTRPFLKVNVGVSPVPGYLPFTCPFKRKMLEYLL